MHINPRFAGENERKSWGIAIAIPEMMHIFKRNSWNKQDKILMFTNLADGNQGSTKFISGFFYVL